MVSKYLYNGVELPDINTVWTDKNTFPYATIMFIGDGSTVSYLVLSSAPLSYRKYQPIPFLQSTSFSLYATENCAATVYFYDTTDSESGGIKWVINEGYENIICEAQEELFNRTFAGENYWANYDLTNYSDGTVYQPASDPVPVGGEPEQPEEPETPTLTNRDLYRKINGKPTKLTLYKKVGGELVTLDEYTKEVKT